MLEESSSLTLFSLPQTSYTITFKKILVQDLFRRYCILGWFSLVLTIPWMVSVSTRLQSNKKMEGESVANFTVETINWLTQNFLFITNHLQDIHELYSLFRSWGLFSNGFEINFLCCAYAYPPIDNKGSWYTGNRYDIFGLIWVVYILQND